MIRGMILDLDGVLVDTARFHYLAWKRLAREWFGLDFTPADNERFKGVNREACMRILCEMAGRTLSEEDFARGMALKNDWYVRGFDGIRLDMFGAERAVRYSARARTPARHALRGKEAIPWPGFPPTTKR